MRLKQKLILIFLLVTFVPLLSLGILVYQRTKQIETQATLSKLEAFADQREKQIETLTRIYQERLRLLSTGTTISNDLAEFNQSPSEGPRGRINQVIQAQQTSLPELKDISVIGANGRVVASTNPSLAGSDQSSQPYFAKARSAAVPADMIKDGNDVLVQVAGPIRGGGQTSGVLSLRFAGDEITKTTQDFQGLGETGDPNLVKRAENGDALSITPLRFNADAAFRVRVPQSATDRPAIRALAKQEQVFTDTMDYRGKPVLATTRYLEGSDWGLVVKLDQAEAFATVTEFRNMLFGLALASSVLLFGLILLLARSITRPLLRLTAVTSRVSEGQLSERANIGSDDEIGELGKSFNQMADKLQRSQKGLTKDVAAKTKELSGKVAELEDTKKAMLNLLEDLRVEKEQAVQEKAKDAAFLQAIGDALIITDEEGKIVLVNACAKKLFGWKRKGVVGMHMFEATDLEDRQGHVLTSAERPLTQVLSGKKSSVSSNLYVRKGDERFPLDFTITPIKVGKKRLGTVAIFRDVTEREEMQQLQKEFVSIASHELRTPITALIGYLSLVKRQDATDFEQTRHFLDRAYAAAGRLSELIEDLLSVARLEEGRVSLNLELMNPSPIVTEVITRLQPKVLDKKIKLEFNNQLKTGHHVEIDQSKLEQVLLNLVDNAIKYTPVRGTVGVTAAATAKEVVITVTDTGIGIHPDNLEKVFDKFFREYTELSVSAGGTGLGLFITRELIERQGGELILESVQGEGTTATVRFPRVPRSRPDTPEG